MKNEDKVAVLLLALDEEQAVSVMKHFSSDEVRRIGKYMNRMMRISNQEINMVAEEFCALARQKGSRILAVQNETIKNIIIKTLGDEKAESVLEMIEDESFRPSDNPVIERLKSIDPKVLVEFTKLEHPQTIALILAHLKSDQAAEVLESLPPEKQREIAKRIATLKSVPREFIDEMAQALESELSLGKGGEQLFGGVNMMAEILNKMSRSSENAILESLEEFNPDIAGDIRALMFTFDDIFNLPDKSIRELLQEIRTDELARALKVLDSGMREKFFKNMSTRAADMLKEDIELMPPIRLSEVEQSQRDIIEIAKRLETEGRIELMRGSGGEDEFV